MAICLSVFTTGCSGDDDPSEGTEPDPDPNPPGLLDRVQYRMVKEYTFDDLKTIESDFFDEALARSFDLHGFLDGLTLIGNDVIYDGNIQMRAYKMSLEPEASEGFKARKLSGIMLVPPLEKGRSYRRVVAPPYTYVMKNEAPTVRIAEDNLDPHLTFWILAAYLHGYAVIIPDYPGFGDSYGQCYIPYMEKDLMVRTTAAYMEAAQAVLDKESYERKTGLIISGYSLGAYVSLQLARALESDASRPETKVDLLIVGGSPCNLLQEANLLRASETMPQPHLFPLTLLGYYKNSYPHLVVNNYLKEPYASGAAIYLNGQQSGYEGYFPKKTADLFTEAFIRNEGMEEVNSILETNSVAPWRNTCKFIMTHGRDDETVYFEQAKDFSEAHTQYGGVVTFSATIGTHTGAGIWFYLRLYTELNYYQ
jgi:pimeloyl-ACP methyl ester carboxylesterase